jgi:hypothetical protein
VTTPVWITTAPLAELAAIEPPAIGRNLPIAPLAELTEADEPATFMI